MTDGIDNEFKSVDSRKKLHDACVKWLNALRDQQSYEGRIQFSDEIIEALSEVKFEVSDAASFLNTYPNCIIDTDFFAKILPSILHVRELAATVYFRLNSWKDDLNEELKYRMPYEGRMWYILAAMRLAQLTAYEDIRFRGIVCEMTLTSVKEYLYTSLLESSDREVNQKLTIRNDGSIEFVAYKVKKDHRYKISRTYKIKYPASTCREIMDKISQPFRDYYQEEFNDTYDSWNLVFVNDHGKEFKYSGLLGHSSSFNGEELSNILRLNLQNHGLFAFDGNNNPIHFIEQLSLRFYHTIYQREDQDSTWKKTLDVKEVLFIDRLNQTLKLSRQRNSQMKITQKFEGSLGIDSFLDAFDIKTFFTSYSYEHAKKYQSQQTPPTIGIHHETRSYEIKLKYDNKSSHIIRSSFDKNGLPTNFKKFATALKLLLDNYTTLDFLKPELYTALSKDDANYIYVKVKFGKNDHSSYSYISQDESIQVGDIVIVPVGKENELKQATVTEVIYCDDSNVPWPVNATKRIFYKLSIPIIN